MKIHKNNVFHRPEDFDEWEIVNGQLVTSFSSFPIHVTLAPISDLLTDDILGTDSTNLKSFFTSEQANFCQGTLMLSEEQCLQSKLSGCKLEGICQTGAQCLNHQTAFDGYQCREWLCNKNNTIVLLTPTYYFVLVFPGTDSLEEDIHEVYEEDSQGIRSNWTKQSNLIALPSQLPSYCAKNRIHISPNTPNMDGILRSVG